MWPRARIITQHARLMVLAVLVIQLQAGTAFLTAAPAAHSLPGNFARAVRPFGCRLRAGVVLRAAGGDSDGVVSPFAEDAAGMETAVASKEMEFTARNVDAVLDSVRPYLIADGGNCRVVEVDKATGDVSLELEGACGNCPSSSVTLKMGIERALREQFGDRLGQVRQVNPQETDALTQELVEGLLAPVLPAVRGLGGDLQVVSIQPSAGAVTIAYKGPEKLTYGIELTLKDHPKINTVSFTALA